MPDRVSVQVLAGVGPRTAARLARLGIHTLQDLLFHLPLYYQDKTRVRPIASLVASERALIRGVVKSCKVQFAGRRSLRVLVDDGTGDIAVRFFHFSRAQEDALAGGVPIQCFGEVRRGRTGFEMVHPELRILEIGRAPPLDEYLTPVYPATEGLTQNSLRKLIIQALERVAKDGVLVDCLSQGIRARLQLRDLRESLESAHRPLPGTSRSDYSVARRRLAFDELLAHHISLRLLRQQLDKRRAPVLKGDGMLAGRFIEHLPFVLTNAQRRVIKEIGADLCRARPMHRLLQGDVGAGKTVVAAVAALQTIEAGYQVALMAPTELLAEQHMHSFDRWFAMLGIKPFWLTGSLTSTARKRVLHAVAANECPAVIGTHALFQHDVRFAKLGLAIVDEQHRFGVQQRVALRNTGVSQGVYPHVLIMTATPIPRTLAMAMYAELDASIIDMLPPERRPVATVVVNEKRRAEVMQRVLEACRRNQQTYWVCTRIEESDSLGCKAAVTTAAALADALPECRVGLVHGRMDSKERDRVMGRFRRGSIDLLVATTVVEVGMDVPRATLMVVENAERMGLAQLHQLRGRVGRGHMRSVCILMYRGPLTAEARARLDSLRNHDDGFAIAERDLDLRGAGEVMGIRQSGLPGLRIADLSTDGELLSHVPGVASSMLAESPECVPLLLQRWLGDRVHYGDV